MSAGAEEVTCVLVRHGVKRHVFHQTKARRIHLLTPVLMLGRYGGYVPQSANKVGTAVTGAVNGLTHQTLQQGTQGTRATPSYRRTPMSVNHSSTTAGYPHTSSPSKSKVDFELSYR